MSTRFFALSVFLLTFILWPAMSVAQELNATLTGTVTDPSGAIVPAATVLIHNNDTNADVRTVTTDGSGNYTATNLPAGTYTVTVQAAGFRSYTANNVTLHVAEKRALNAALEAGQVAETVNVEETATPIETSTAAQAGTITGTQVRELELNNRNFEQLVLLQPGVTNGLPDQVGFGLSNSTTISVNGARVTSNNWTVDGADINDSGSNGTLLNVPSVDAIQEFTLQRSTYDAQYGRSGGGQVLVATKSGTSAYHGDAYEFVRNDFFNANDFFSNSAGTPRAIERYNNFGFTVGGPLFVPKLYSKKESKTFFFWSEEWRKTSTPATFNQVAPTAAELSGVVPGTVTGAAPPGHNL
jgi:Carboxypeptidase regulatory-like domain/TonB-dependent Receptor Plug Domain